VSNYCQLFPVQRITTKIFRMLRTVIEQGLLYD
jgi:hypothetical protein